MKRFYFGKNGKLVRDKIAELTISQKHGVKTRNLNKDVIPGELLKKLPEEIRELVKAFDEGGAEEEKKELADVLTLIRSYVKERGFDMTEIEEIVKDKATKRGGFKDGLIIEYVDLDPKGDDYEFWLNHFRSDPGQYIEEKLND